MMKLYHTPTYRSARVTWLIEELGAQKDFEIIIYNPYKATLEEAKWYKENVQYVGQVPGFVLENGKVMTESGAICMYLAEKYNKLMPDKEEKSDYLMWIFSATSTADFSFSLLFTQMGSYKAEERDPRLIKLHTGRINGFLRGLDHHLEGKQYICGDKFTVADIVAGYTLMSIIILETFMPVQQNIPRVRDYFSKLKSRPGFITGVGVIEEITKDWKKVEEDRNK